VPHCSCLFHDPPRQFGPSGHCITNSAIDCRVLRRSLTLLPRLILMCQMVEEMMQIERSNFLGSDHPQMSCRCDRSLMINHNHESKGFPKKDAGTLC